MIPRHLSLANGRIELSFTEMGMVAWGAGLDGNLKVQFGCVSLLGHLLFIQIEMSSRQICEYGVQEKQILTGEIKLE